MIRLLITGDGFPLYRVAAAALAMPAVSVAGIIVGSTSSIQARRLAEDFGVGQWPLAVLTGRRPFPDELAADWLVNINGTTIIDSSVIARFRDRAVNMHPGLLPQYAGLHCHQWAIRNGESIQGVTVHLMDDGIDTGPVLSQRAFPLSAQDTGLSLFRRTMDEGTSLLLEVIGRIATGDVPAAVPQDLSRRHLYRHRDALDGALNWTSNMRQIVDFVRAANYEPLRSPTYTPLAILAGKEFEIRTCEAVRANGMAPPGTLVKAQGDPIVACGDGAVRITRAFFQGKVVAPDDWGRLLANVQ